MAVQVAAAESGKFVDVHVSGKLTKEDYEHFVPELERLIAQHGKLRILFEMHDFHGWQAGALWADVKFDLKHFNDIERLAMVGETRWQAGMSAFCRPFTTAKIKYFTHEHIAEARTWLQGD
jgi:hypothetical protein